MDRPGKSGDYKSWRGWGHVGLTPIARSGLSERLIAPMRAGRLDDHGDEEATQSGAGRAELGDGGSVVGQGQGLAAVLVADAELEKAA